ncbi:MAG: four helix bundle protein [Parcubacteria group bacterium]|nr:four helix bundle protein [Parcubacteria group bacterium]
METLPIINLSYEVYKIVVDINNHAEKRWRYSLGASMENTILDCLSELIMAKNAPKPLKAGYLNKANANLEIAVLKLRLFLELKIANETKIFQAQAKIREIGKMLGGWLKSLQNV